MIILTVRDANSESKEIVGIYIFWKFETKGTKTHASKSYYLLLREWKMSPSL